MKMIQVETAQSTPAMEKHRANNVIQSNNRSGRMGLNLEGIWTKNQKFWFLDHRQFRGTLSIPKSLGLK